MQISSIVAGLAALTLRAEPGTDIWKKPPSTDVFTAATHVHSVQPLANFMSASISFTANYTIRYDQAGLLLKLTNPSIPNSRKWIKTGIEFYNDMPRLSTVTSDNWADWSVAPVSRPKEVQHGQRRVSILVQKEHDENGFSWWVYNIEGCEKIPMREICWVAADQMADGWQLEVSAVVARPSKETDEQLEAKFEELNVVWSDG